MPKLVILAACERVIVDRIASLPSLINIFQRMNIQLQDAPLPENAISPSRWAIFALWQHTLEERGVVFTQRTEVISPTDQKFAEASTQFSVTEADDLQSKNHLELFGLPINDEGYIKVRVWLEGYADSTGEYRFLVKYLPKEGKHEESADARTTVTA
jgi:hypothetical protein